MISQWYEPEPGAAAHPTAVARALAAAGNDVRVLTGFPNYPTGRVYPDYKMRLRSREVRDGIELLRVPLHPSHDNSAAHRAASLGSFALSASVQVAWLRDADSLLVYMSPATAGIPALLLRALRRKPYVLYVQDLWPDSVMASGFLRDSRLSRGVESAINSMCSALYRHASSIAVIAPSMRQTLIARGVDSSKIHVVYNWVDEQTFKPRPPSPKVAAALASDAFWLMYAGGIGDVQGLETAVRAIEALRDRPDIRLAFVGDGVAAQRLKQLVNELQLKQRVIFLGSQPMADMPGIMAAADAQLVSLMDLPLFHGTIPSKTQSTLACGQPVIVSAPGDSSELVAKAEAGMSVPPENHVELAKAIARMADLSSSERTAMGRRGRNFYNKNLSSHVGGARLHELLGDATASPKRRNGGGRG